MTPSPDPQSDRKRLSADELIAVFVALTSIGAIFFWSISQNRGLDTSFLQSPLMANTPTVTPSPTPLPSSTVQTNTAVMPPKPDSVAVPSAPPASPSAIPPALQAAPFIALAPSAVPSPSTASAPPAAQPKQFADVPAGYWASAPIAALSAHGILDGFPDGSFKPNKPITRVEFAAMVRRAFNQPVSRGALKFSDVKADSQASATINKATQTRFMSGFPDGSFQPNLPIPRLQVLLALATGLNLQTKASPNQILSRYQDAEQIPRYALAKIAAATEAGLVLNNANPQLLVPNQVTTRAEAAALIYAALKK